MVSRVFSAGLSGIDGYIVTVECFLSGGLPRLDVVGLPTGAVSEAGERVRAAAKACAFDWPVSRLTVNLAPADKKRQEQHTICLFCFPFWRQRARLMHRPTTLSSSASFPSPESCGLSAVRFPWRLPRVMPVSKPCSFPR